MNKLPAAESTLTPHPHSPNGHRSIRASPGLEQFFWDCSYLNRKTPVLTKTSILRKTSILQVLWIAMAEIKDPLAEALKSWTEKDFWEENLIRFIVG